jgi:hypothetical protein
MARYGRNFMGRVRGMWDRFAEQMPDARPRPRPRRTPMDAMGPGGEGYFLSHDMVRHADYTLDYNDRGRGDVGSRGFPPGDMAQFGRAGAGRGYGGDYRTGRGGYDAGEFFVNRHPRGDTGYRAYQRDLGMRGYDRGYGGGGYDRGMRYGRDFGGGR